VFTLVFYSMAGVAFIAHYLVCALPLKRVVLDGTNLIISNYRSSIVVPLREVRGVGANERLCAETVTLTFRAPTAFGDRVVFLAGGRLFRRWSPNPIVGELRGIISDAILEEGGGGEAGPAFRRSG